MRIRLEYFKLNWAKCGVRLAKRFPVIGKVFSSVINHYLFDFKKCVNSCSSTTLICRYIICTNGWQTQFVSRNRPSSIYQKFFDSNSRQFCPDQTSNRIICYVNVTLCHEKRQRFAGPVLVSQFYNPVRRILFAYRVSGTLRAASGIGR